jgi:hypothetical protein
LFQQLIFQGQNGRAILCVICTLRPFDRIQSSGQSHLKKWEPDVAFRLYPHSTGGKFSKDRACRRCNCPKWVGGQIAKTRQWAEAEAVRQQLEDALVKGLPPFEPGSAVAESAVSEIAGEAMAIPKAPSPIGSAAIAVC